MLFAFAIIAMTYCNSKKVGDNYLETPEGRLDLAQKYISESMHMGAVAFFNDGVLMLDSIKMLYPNSPQALVADSILQKKDSLLEIVNQAYKINIVNRSIKEPTFKKDEITVVLSIDNNGIRITNKSTREYTDVRLKLNDKYKVEITTLSGLEEKKIYYSEFSDSDNERFNPITEAVKTVYIAGEYQGEKYWAFFKAK